MGLLAALRGWLGGGAGGDDSASTEDVPSVEPGDGSRTEDGDGSRTEGGDGSRTEGGDGGDTDADAMAGSAARDEAADLEPPERFRSEAEELADYWPEHDLDFTPASLERLDAFVDGQWDSERFRDLDGGEDGVHMDELVFEGLVVQLGSYFGETLVRTNEAATWENHEEFGWVVAVDGPDGELLSNVFHVSADCLREPAKFAASYDVVMAQSGAGDPIGADRDGVVTIEVSVPDADTDPREFRTAADRLVADFPWYDLDYTPGSLATLDQLVSDEIFDGEHLVDAFQGEELSAIVERLGSYFGETLVESHGGVWVHDDGWHVGVELDGSVKGVDAFRAAMAVLHEGTTFVAIYDGFVSDDGDAPAE